MRRWMKNILITYLPAAVAAAVSACAVIEPPTGGPEDTEPPAVVSFSPRPDSAGVSRHTALNIEFSEKVDGESFKDRVRLYPPVEFDKVKVKGRYLEIRFKEPLPETTICVHLEPGFKDVHGVRSDGHRQHLLVSSHHHLDHASAHRRLHGLLSQLLLSPLHLLLQLLDLLGHSPKLR